LALLDYFRQYSYTLSQAQRYNRQMAAKMKRSRFFKLLLPALALVLLGGAPLLSAPHAAYAAPKKKQPNICVIAGGSQTACPNNLKKSQGKCFVKDLSNSKKGFQEEKCTQRLKASDCPGPTDKDGLCEGSVSTTEQARKSGKLGCTQKGGCNLVKKYVDPAIVTLSVLVAWRW
jgi:hypothetical protein